jgi:hypothetical protein
VWLRQQYWRIAQDEGHPLRDVLFRPLKTDRKSFEEKVVDTGTVRNRLKVHFKDTNVGYHTTTHGNGCCDTVGDNRPGE